MGLDGHTVRKIAETVLTALGEVVLLAGAGVLLTRKGVISKQVRSAMAKISAEVAIPCLLFDSMLRSASTRLISDGGWFLLILPVVYVAAGCLVGHIAATLGKAPSNFRKGMVAAVAFGNSTGLPIVLLSVIRAALINANGPLDPGRSAPADPVAYLAIYLLVYPVLQWGIGGALLRQASPPGSPPGHHPLHSPLLHPTDRQLTTIAGMDPFEDLVAFTSSPRRLSVSAVVLPVRHASSPAPVLNRSHSRGAADYIPIASSAPAVVFPDPGQGPPRRPSDSQEAFLPVASINTDVEPRRRESMPLDGAGPEAHPEPGCCRRALHGVVALLRHFLVPPAIASLLGVFCGLVHPVRDIMYSDAPKLLALGWFSQGVHRLGQAAVPINMLILGSNLAKGPHWHELPVRAAVCGVIAKMIIMPVVGLGACALYNGVFANREHTWPGQFFDDNREIQLLVMAVVACTPTANNLAVMCELAGQNREAMATLIFVQYLCAPVVLTATVMSFLFYISVV
eukprot:TRINITY_DN36555_c0_g1_i1.p1 TRINITY_DN36555_c0_g1~~TRINITY_DN36555_c0_g1_i1.p1  ORF type:complete len:511 (+),score=82.58 TRINITY_DN36555_c0_g1_i1:82-1614(+)